MISDMIARTGMTIVFGGVALVLTVNADCSGFPEQPCESILGTTMPQVDRLQSVLWIAAAAVLDWFVFSIAVGATVLYFERKLVDRDPAIANSNEGFLSIVAFFALIGFIAGLIAAFMLARRRWARRPTDPETTKTRDPVVT